MLFAQRAHWRTASSGGIVLKKLNVPSATRPGPAEEAEDGLDLVSRELDRSRHIAVLEVLGIDNIVFISILATKLPTARQARARNVGLALAMTLHPVVVVADLDHAPHNHAICGWRPRVFGTRSYSGAFSCQRSVSQTASSVEPRGLVRSLGQSLVHSYPGARSSTA